MANILMYALVTTKLTAFLQFFRTALTHDLSNKIQLAACPLLAVYVIVQSFELMYGHCHIELVKTVSSGRCLRAGW